MTQIPSGCAVGCAGADAFLVKPLGAGEVTHLWQYMKQRRLPIEASHTRDIESIRALSLTRSPHRKKEYAERPGGGGGASEEQDDGGLSDGVEQGDDSAEIDVSDLAITSSNIAPSLPSCSTFAVAASNSSSNSLPELSNLLSASSTSSHVAVPRPHNPNLAASTTLSSISSVASSSPPRPTRGIDRRHTKESHGSLHSATSGGTSVEAHRDPDEGPVGADCKQQ